VLCLAAVLSLYLALACALYARWRRGRPAADALLFAALWLLAELARGLLFTGFPWVASATRRSTAPLAGLAPWVGVYGIGACWPVAAALASAWPVIRPRRGVGLCSAHCSWWPGAVHGPGRSRGPGR
jgi:apolipoprotein N-acyltransferase